MLSVARTSAASLIALTRPHLCTASPTAPWAHRAVTTIHVPRRGMVQIRGVNVTPRRMAYAAIGLVGGYAVWHVFYYVTSVYLDLTVFDMGEIGFFAGVLFSASVVGSVMLLRRFGVPHPDNVTSLVLKRLRQDTIAQTRLGLPLQLGEFKSYSYKGGLSLTGYQPKRLQMILQVAGPKDSGIVTFDVSRRWRSGLQFRSLCLDVASTNERVLYAGTQNDVIFKGSIRG